MMEYHLHGTYVKYKTRITEKLRASVPQGSQAPVSSLNGEMIISLIYLNYFWRLLDLRLIKKQYFEKNIDLKQQHKQKQQHRLYD